MATNNLVLHDLELALLEAQRTGSSKAVFRELSKVEEAWWIVNRKGETWSETIQTHFVSQIVSGFDQFQTACSDQPIVSRRIDRFL